MNYLYLITLLFTFLNLAFAAELGLKTLIISAKGSDVAAIKLSLDSYGILYDHVELKINELQGNLSLYDSKKNPKYNMIVLASGKLTLKDDSSNYVSVLNDEQWAYLDQYEIDNKVRRVTISDSSDSTLGISIYDTNKWGTSNTQNLIKADNSIANEMFNNAGLKFNAPINTKG